MKDALTWQEFLCAFPLIKLVSVVEDAVQKMCFIFKLEALRGSAIALNFVAALIRLNLRCINSKLCNLPSTPFNFAVNFEMSDTEERERATQTSINRHLQAPRLVLIPCTCGFRTLT